MASQHPFSYVGHQLFLCRWIGDLKHPLVLDMSDPTPWSWEGNHCTSSRAGMHPAPLEMGRDSPVSVGVCRLPSAEIEGGERI